MQCPKPQPIAFNTVDSLSMMLMSYGGTQADILYYEVLDLPLEEFEKVKTVKVSSFCKPITGIIHLALPRKRGKEDDSATLKSFHKPTLALPSTPHGKLYTL